MGPHFSAVPLHRVDGGFLVVLLQCYLVNAVLVRPSHHLGFSIVFLHFRWDFLGGFSRLFSTWDSKKVQRNANLVDFEKRCKMRLLSLS